MRKTPLILALLLAATTSVRAQGYCTPFAGEANFMYMASPIFGTQLSTGARWRADFSTDMISGNGSVTFYYANGDVEYNQVISEGAYFRLIDPRTGRSLGRRMLCWGEDGAAYWANVDTGQITSRLDYKFID